MYFGDDHIGLFRKFPGQYRQTCGRYDPRVRPWYVNSLSPPRDVIILVDLSGSMRAGSAITHAINSAQYIIERLNVADSFAVVAFGTRVQQIYPEGGGMVNGNLENTANAAGALADIQATREAVGTGSSQVDAFNAAFDLLQVVGCTGTADDGASTCDLDPATDATAACPPGCTTAVTSNCKKAIVFLSDNKASIGLTPETDVAANVATRNAALPQPAVVFAYAVGREFTSDGGVGKSIACQTGGIWAPVPSTVPCTIELSRTRFCSLPFTPNL